MNIGGFDVSGYPEHSTTLVGGGSFSRAKQDEVHETSLPEVTFELNRLLHGVGWTHNSRDTVHMCKSSLIQIILNLSYFITYQCNILREKFTRQRYLESCSLPRSQLCK